FHRAVQDAQTPESISPPRFALARRFLIGCECSFAEQVEIALAVTGQKGEKSMVRIAVLALSLIVAGVEAGCAQDIAGIEDCTKAAGVEKRTGGLQSSVNVLQRLVRKNARDAENKLDIAAAEIVALKGVVTRLEKTVGQLEAAQKAAGDKKPETK